jgi:tetratricopeptide (TPR) repeat protein
MRKPTLTLGIVYTAGLIVSATVIWYAIGGAQRAAIIELKSEPNSTADDSEDRSERSVTHTLIDDQGILANSGLAIANAFAKPVQNPDSLEELRQSIQSRGVGAISELQAELERLRNAPGSQDQKEAELQYRLGTLFAYEGRFDEATVSLEKARSLSRSSGLSLDQQQMLTAYLGIVAFRQGELDNCIACLGPSSCIFPIAPAAVHEHQAGSRKAIEYFTAYLKESPGDLRVRWLLNLAYMTLGEYPDKVPAKYRIPLDHFQSRLDVGRFENVAPRVGLTQKGPNLAGGSIFDDFTGDGLPDLLTTSLDVDRGASLYVNRGDGTFEERSESAGLDDQIYALNVAAADFDNDGNLDVVLLRGGWEQPMRLSLLRNSGKDQFEDVTIASGLSLPITTEAAAWGDFDNDGLVDLFVCGEYLPPDGPPRGPPDPRNRCRLYHNLGQGKFVDIAAAAGVTNERCAKGSAWGDYDGDGRLDLYVSNMNGRCRLYHNEGQGKFRDVAPELDVTGPSHGFSCWFWDFDNDGRLDISVNDYSSYLADIVAAAAGVPARHPSRPRLFRNEGSAGFRDVTLQVGLDRAMMPMGCNVGDIDNDGYLDLYFGTGRMSLEQLVPNLMFKNVAGRSFEDVTMSSHTGHLQKGHGISFADFDGDGDLDLFVEAGGAVPGDKAYNLLFQNPGHGRHWLKVKLIGTKSNRAALGARLRAVVEDSDGTRRSIYRTVGNNSSFGGNSLVQLIGLLDATSVAELEVFWPASGTTQVFRNLPADQSLEITEGDDTLR